MDTIAVKEIFPSSKAGERWSMDFVHDNLVDGRAIRILTVIEEATRECVHVEVDTSLSSRRVVGILERIAQSRQLPIQIGVDRGPEFTSGTICDWFDEKEIKPCYCSPGNKNENAFIIP